jgi:FkbM family methyltransferase
LERRAHDYFLQEFIPRPGDTVVDVGAGIGDEVHTFSRLVGEGGRVFAIEAHPSTFELLERRCRLSRLTNVELAQVAIADKAGVITISDVEMDIANSIVGQSGGGVKVPAQTLDDFVAERGIELIDFLKMNIEGAERYAIEGMTATRQLVRNVCICCHDFLAEETGIAEMRTKSLIRSFLEDSGFEVVDRRPGDRRPWSRDYLYGRRPPR